VAEVVFESFFGVRRQSQAPDVNYFGVEKSFGVGFGIFNQGIDQVLGLGAG
jgi:hypothetical protein